MDDPTPADVVRFWEEAGPERWYNKDDAFDGEIAEKFGDLHTRASAGTLDGWAETPEGLLALLILFDQFSRNLKRGQRTAFANDARALELARAGIERGLDGQVPEPLRQFIYTPFMHSEAPADQERSVALFTDLMEGANLKYALEHRDIIRRFGRFPHRNAVLGRDTTAEERAFLDGGGFAG